MQGESLKGCVTLLLGLCVLVALLHDRNHQPALAKDLPDVLMVQSALASSRVGVYNPMRGGGG